MIWFNYNSAIPGRTVCDHNQSRYSGVPWTTRTLRGKDLTVHIVFHHRIQCFKKNQLQGKSEVKVVDYKYLIQYFPFLILDNKID